ncbi:hypothetical protein ACSBR1_029945 [Camellia fascicularis]
MIMYLLFNSFSPPKNPSNFFRQPSDMSDADIPQLTLYFLALLSLLCRFSGANSDDLQILLNIKTSLQNSNTNIFNSWETQNSICNFTGISCYSDGSVKAIELSNQQLSGTVPFDSICQLKSLQKLSLGQLTPRTNHRRLEKMRKFTVFGSRQQSLLRWGSRHIAPESISVSVFE